MDGLEDGSKVGLTLDWNDGATDGKTLEEGKPEGIVEGATLEEGKLEGIVEGA